MRVRNIVILSVSQALGVSGVAIVALLSGLIGTDLAPSPAWATLPASLMIVGGTLAVIPASLLMKRIGRRWGFLAATAVAGLAALLAAYAVVQGDFFLFCLATALIGLNGAFVQQYRFAAAESADPARAGRAVSLVLVGGILAGFIGPEIANRTRDWLPAGVYAGSFLSLALLYAGAAVLLLFLQDVATAADGGVRGEERPLRTIVFQPVFLAAILAGVAAYGVMLLIMTSTPIFLHRMHGFSLDETTRVIQGHIVAMFLPSLVSGFIVERLGVKRVIVLGVLAMAGSVLLALTGGELLSYAGALILLGLGWNLLYVGATVLLTHSYLPAERFKVQAANDLVLNATQAGASFSSGPALAYLGWQSLNLATLPLLAVTLLVVLFLRSPGLAGSWKRRSRRGAEAQ